jgi:hypothetical protein
MPRRWPLAYFGPIEISGNTASGSATGVLLRKLNFKPRRALPAAASSRTHQRQLYQMELFQFVNIERQSERSRRRCPVRVTIAKANTSA